MLNPMKLSDADLKRFTEEILYRYLELCEAKKLSGEWKAQVQVRVTPNGSQLASQFSLFVSLP